ncbi:alpha/beta fold hydrolase [Miltoncostaea oceani]|uniref:alpha/beta fold hydrolase n=1 Tax=Miltoncostaea oceani TaxID=2843216 RepID=UPI001C3E3BF2|nr:alpha/beta fold hydrolase [Miltoncostaea oceani]
MTRVVHRGGRRRVPVFGRDDRGLAIDLVMTHTEDGQNWDGMLFRPADVEDARRRRLAVLVIHGSVGNYLTGVPRRVSFGLANAGFSVMSVNTRMANYGVFFGGGLMHRTPLDLDAALQVLRRRGFRRIVLLGFSMGSTIVTHYQALRLPPDVVGVCTLAHPASLPAALRLRWDHFGAEPGYQEVAETVHNRLAPDFEDASRDRIFLVRRARGFGDRPLDCEIWTYRTWWHARGPRAPHAESRLRVGHVTVPLAIIQAGEDELVREGEGPELEALARQGDCPSVYRTTIPDADHVFTGLDAELIDAVVGWLDLRLPGG